MRRVILDRKIINAHRAAYSAVVWEIVDLLAHGTNVLLGDYDSAKAMSISWAKDYFKMLSSRKRLGDLLVAKPSVLQRIIIKEKEFLLSIGYVVKGGRICASPRQSKEAQKRQKTELIIVRNLCSKVFDYNLFVSGNTYECVDPIKHTYVFVNTPKHWGGDLFREKINVKQCLYCNIDDVVNHPLARKYNGRIKTTISHVGFDHYFEKSLYPFLALSIYNLIPCCERCNQKYKTQTIMDVSQHSHPYVNDFHDLMMFDTEFDKLRQIQGNPKEAPLILKMRGINVKEEILADTFSQTIGLLSVYRNRAIDETMNIVRAIDRRLSEYGNNRSRKGGKLRIKERNLTDPFLNWSRDEINQHRCAKLTIDLVDKYCSKLR